MRKFDGVIFDLDGTLLDSVGLWADIDREFLGSYGFSVPDDYMDAVMSLTFRETAEYTIRRFGLRDTIGSPGIRTCPFSLILIDIYPSVIKSFSEQM